MAGSPFLSFYIISYLWDKTRRHIMNLPVCGTFMHSLQWTLGFGVLFSTVGEPSNSVFINCCKSPVYIFIARLDCYYMPLKCSDVVLTEKLDYSSAVALLGFSLILAILRSFNARHEATRVMVAAPLLAFALTHILYINFYELDYGNCYSFFYPFLHC